MKRFTMLLGLGLAVITLSWVFAPVVAEGIVPERINIQGILKDAGGNPVADGSYSVIFTIYNDEFAGTVYWAETTSVTTAGGLFNHRMGAANAIPDTAIRLNTWLGIKVGADPEMTPRPRLVSVSHAYKVSTVTGASGGNVTGDIYLLGSGADDYLGLVTSDPNVAIELRSGTFGGDPFIDFANDAVSDYDARIQLQGNDGLQIAVPSILSVPTGKVGIGTTTPGSSAGLENTRLEIADGTGLNSDVALRVSGGGATGSAALNFAKSRGNLSTPTGVQSGDLLGHILFLGYDGSDFSSPAAWIQASVDGTPGTDDMPGRLEFKTTPDGSATPATRMTINNAGSVGIGTTSPTTRLHVLEDNDTLSALTIENPNTGTLSTEAILFNSEDGSGPASGASIFVTDGGHPSFPALMRINNSRPGGSIDFSTGNNRRMVIENGGDVGIGTLNAVNKLDVEGGVAIGAGYSGTIAAPANGLVVEGNVGIGLGNPTTPLSVAGQISQSGGTAAAPAYTFVGDLNTGIFQPNADAIGISTLGLARVTVTNFGEVGIGTTGPDVPLHVEGGVDATLANGSGYAVIGSVSSTNIVMDNNEIQARNNAAASTLNLQADGGDIFAVAGGGSVSIGAPVISAVKLAVEESGAAVASFNRTTTDGTVLQIQQDGISEGNISVSGTTVTYGAFTGAHYGWTDEMLERGELVTLTSINRNSHDNPKSEVIYGIKRSSVPNDPACLGSYLALSESNKPYSSENPHLVMAVGNGDMWVVDEGQNILPGDYLISSSTPGHAMKDDEQVYPIGHIVARAAEGVDWSIVNEMADGKKHKKISVLFGNFVRSNPSTVAQALENLQEIILKQQQEIEELKKAVLKNGSSVMAETER